MTPSKNICVCRNLIPTPVNTTTPLIRPKYCSRTVVGVPLYIAIISMGNSQFNDDILHQLLKLLGPLSDDDVQKFISDNA